MPPPITPSVQSSLSSSTHPFLRWQRRLRALLLTGGLAAAWGCGLAMDPEPVGELGRTLGTPLTFTPEADARVERNRASRNFGTSSTLGVDSSPVLESYLRFEVSGVGTAGVASARLQVYATDASSNGPAIYVAGGDWTERGITWNNRPPRVGSALDDRGSIRSGTWVEYDVTAAVKGDGRYSFVLVGTSSDGADFQSREGARPPRLVVTPADPEPSEPPPDSPDAGTGSEEPTPTTPITGISYHVDSVNGSDSNDGRSPSTAWRSLSKANAAPLQPGDALLFARGSVFNGKLALGRSGTSSAPIQVGAYGTGAAPIFQGASTCVELTGSFVALRDIQAQDCTWSGVTVSGDDNVLERLHLTRNAAGVDVKAGATRNRILRSQLVDNNRMSVLTQGGDDDSGAFGILLHGDQTEVAYNTISGCDAFSYDYGRDGAAIEIYGGQGNHIHHNVAIDNDAFTELGNSRSADNTFAYNLVQSSLESSIFLVTRGAASGWGPVLRTRLYNNTVRLTGSSSQGFVCHAGCSPDILVMRNNIIEAAWKVGYADAPFDENDDLFFRGQRQFVMGSRSLVADPLFVDAARGDLRLQAGSPAIDRGVILPYTTDLDGTPVPTDGNGDGSAVPDLGAYERR